MNKIDSVKVFLKEKSYKVIIGRNLLKREKNKIFSSINKAKKIFIITDFVIKKLHLKSFLNFIPKKFIIETIVIKTGEKTKQLKTVEQILNFLLKKKFQEQMLFLHLEEV